MLIIWICALIGLFWGICYGVNEGMDIPSKFGYSFIYSVILSISGGVFGFFIAFIFGLAFSLNSYLYEFTLIEQTPIYSIAENIETNIPFTLGRGQINKDLKYYYITKRNFKSQIENISTSFVQIKLTKELPSLKTYRNVYKNSNLNLISFNVSSHSYILEIPENTEYFDYDIIN